MQLCVGKFGRSLQLLAVIGFVSGHISATGSARAEDAEQLKRGAALSQTWCSACHVTGAQSQRSAADIAPPLAEIANNKKVSDARIRGVLNRPHGRMPTDAMTTRQIADVVAYILSLRKQPR